MVFLGAWALFGFGTLASGRTGVPSPSVTNVGRVLSTSGYRLAVPVAFTDTGVHARGITGEELAALYIEHPKLQSSSPPREKLLGEPHEEPTPEQVLGRIFAWLCTTLYLTSRLPQIWKNVRFQYSLPYWSLTSSPDHDSMLESR